MMNDSNFVGIVVGRREFDKGCFLDILTDTLGVVEVVALGGKSGKNSVAAGLSLFSYSDFSAVENDSRITVKSAVPKYVFWNLTQNYEALSLACYFAEIVKYTRTPGENSAELLRFLLITLYETENRYCDSIKPIFETRVTAYLGFAPDLISCGNCGVVLSPDVRLAKFDFKRGGVICEKCAGGVSGAFLIEINNAALDLLRNALFGKIDKIYKNAEFSGLKRGVVEINAAFAAASEKYLAYHLDKHFKSLDYFKSAKAF